MRKELTSILKSDELRPKELALLLLTDIHEKQWKGKEILAEKDKAILMQRVKNFELREDCYEYNRYGKAYFEGAQVNVDVGFCGREAIRLTECLKWLILLYLENRMVVNLVGCYLADNKKVKDTTKLMKELVVKHINFYIKELEKIYGGLLTYKKILDKRTEYVGLDINCYVNKVINRITEQVKEHNETIEHIGNEHNFYVELKGVNINEELYDETMKFLGEIEHFKTA